MRSKRINFFILILWLAFNSGPVSAEITIEGINSNVTITGNNPYILRMNENNHSFKNKTDLFKVVAANDETCSSLSVDFIEPATFGYNLEECIFSSTQSFDYEIVNQRTYLIEMKSKTNYNDKIDIRLNILNIDDEPPVIDSFKCEFDEETDYNVTNSQCKTDVTDPDGWLNQTTFKIIAGTKNEDEIFYLKFRDEPSDTVYTWPVYMFPMDKLKYNQTNFYIFSVSAQDGAEHESESNSAIVNVKDLRNTYPIWTLLTRFLEIEEQQAQNFTVTAIDGDTGINDPICYYKVKEDLPEDDYISVNETSGRVDVKRIDRDKDDLTLYKFEIEACVCNLDRDWCTRDEVTFVINDIDNNPPRIMENVYTNGTTETFQSNDTKVVYLSYLENYSTSYNFSTVITDIDTGINAQFTVYLENQEYDNYTEPYIIVPGVGYRNGSFQISVKDKKYLDFEDEKWKEHQYYVISEGVQNKTHSDKMLIKVSLIDYNDELPVFDQPSYSTSMNETVKAGFVVITTHATDRDAEDEILKMNILGSYVEERLDINSDGVITVKQNNSFDYDVLQSIYFQVTATDKVNHVTSVPVIINILDVNNKAPTINPVSRIFVEENQKNGVILNITITASDLDTTANLTSYIDWNRTTITKTNSYIEIDDEIKTAMNFLEVNNTQTNGGRGLQITLMVINNNDDNPDKPDFELFDTLNLALTVEDRNTDPEFEDQRTTTGTIVISITDINDNPPSFPDSNNIDRSADEAASKGASVGFIKATDVDTVDSDISYYCIAEDKNYDWIEVNETSGALGVKNDGEIDADIPIYYLKYKCWAYDGLFFSQPLIVPIYIVDTNNKYPEITNIGVLTVEEQSPAGTNVSYIYTSDKDRDEPFHSVTCSLATFSDSNGENDETVCAKLFNFDKDNSILVTTGGDDLNRDRGPTNYTCRVGCKDNQFNERSQGINTANQTFIIKLLDINNNAPILNTTKLEGTENLKKGEQIGVILGEDIDEGPNAAIDFTIESAIYDVDGKDYKNLFEINKTDDYERSLTTKQVHLVATENLENKYGTYELTMFLKDEGDPPLNSTGTIELTINKYNYHSPEIKFPVNNEKYRLLSYQTPGKPLQWLDNDAELPNFQATDGISEECSKWDVDFHLKQDEDNIFVLKQGDIKCQSQLQITDDFASKFVLKKNYSLSVTASVKEGTEADGEAPYSSTVSITIVFVDNQEPPTFPEHSWNFSLVEVNKSQVVPLKYKAQYDDLPDMPIFYDIVSDNDTIKQSLFKIDEKSGELSVIGDFYYDFDRTFQFQIVASNDTNFETSTDENSFLDVGITVLSSNRRPPKWTKDAYFGAIMPDFVAGYIVLTAQAHDEDAIDQGHLECTISSDFKYNGTGIDKIVEPFYMDSTSDSGKIYLNFRVESSMSGIFNFKIAVKDHQDPYGNGPHTTETDVTIFIINSENTVDFRFFNEKNEVYERETEMLQIITEVLGYQAYTQSIDDQITADDSATTTARLYFIETKGQTFNLIKRDTILGLVGNVKTYVTLSSRLRKEQQLLLLNFDATNTGSSNSEAVLKAWLTGVTVVLGTLVLILLITLILKIRQLNRRISKLTTRKFGSQDSGLNRMGITAPTTNKHAIEGSNPVYKSDNTKNVSDLDTQSVRSGDSELIGVEENPEFDYNFSPDKTTFF